MAMDLCIICGGGFRKISRNQRYCTIDCAREALYRRKPRLRKKVGEQAQAYCNACVTKYIKTKSSQRYCKRLECEISRKKEYAKRHRLKYVRQTKIKPAPTKKNPFLKREFVAPRNSDNGTYDQQLADFRKRMAKRGINIPSRTNYKLVGIL